MEKVFENYPKQIWKSFQSNSLSYYLDIQYFALQGDYPKDLEKKLVYAVEDFYVFKANPRDYCHFHILPTYRLENNPLPYVPTGKIFIRFTPGVQAKEKSVVLHDLDYCIDEISNEAMHTAWIKSCHDDASEALRQLASLRNVAQLENAEPQMLMPKRGFL